MGARRRFQMRAVDEVLQCPDCGRALSTEFRDGKRASYACSTCHSNLVPLAVLAAQHDSRKIVALWDKVKDRRDLKAGVVCPDCVVPMWITRASDSGRESEVHICKVCHLVWIKAHWERALLEAQQRAQAEAARRTRLGEAEGESKFELGALPPDQAWKYFAAAVGLPIEVETNHLTTLPVATWGLGLFLAVVAFRFLHDDQAAREAIHEWAFYCAAPGRGLGITWISSFFVPIDRFQALVQVYGLIVFGRRVECDLEWKRFFGLIAFSTVVANFVALHYAPKDTVLIGAGGGVSGLLAYYLLKFPETKIGFNLNIGFGGMLRLPAELYFLYVIVQEGRGVVEQISGTAGPGDANHIAHLGGLAAGVCYYAFENWRRYLEAERNAAPKSAST